MTRPRPAPTTPFLDAAGKAHPGRVQGQGGVVNLWATWCAPCVQEMPTLAKLAQASAGQPLAVVPISLDNADDAANAQAFIAKAPTAAVLLRHQVCAAVRVQAGRRKPAHPLLNRHRRQRPGPGGGWAPTGRVPTPSESSKPLKRRPDSAVVGRIARRRTLEAGVDRRKSTCAFLNRNPLLWALQMSSAGRARFAGTEGAASQRCVIVRGLARKEPRPRV